MIHVPTVIFDSTEEMELKPKWLLVLPSDVDTSQRLIADYQGAEKLMSRAEAIRLFADNITDDTREKLANSFASHVRGPGIDTNGIPAPGDEQTQPDPIAAVEQAIADAVKAAVAPVSSGGGVSAAIHHLKDAQSALPALREMKEDGYWQQFVDMNTKYWELHSDLESARQRYEAIENKAAGLAEKLEQVEADHHRELSELGKELSRRQDVIDKVSARRDKWRARYEHTKRLASGKLAAKQNIAEAYKADRDRLQAELDALQASHDRLQGDLNDTQDSLTAARREVEEINAKYHSEVDARIEAVRECQQLNATIATQRGLLERVKSQANAGFIGKSLFEDVIAQLAQPSEGREGEGREHTGEHWEPWGFMGTGMASQAAAQRREAAREKLDRDAGSLPSIQEIQLVADAAQPMRNGDEHGWLLTDDDYTLLRAAALAVAHQPQQAGGEPAVHQLLEAIGDNRPWGIERTSDINWIGPLKRGGKVDTIYFRNERGHALKAEAHRCNDALSDLVVLAVNRLIEQHRLTPTQPDHEPEQAKGQVRWYAVDTGILIRKADAVTLVKKDGTTQQQGKWGDADERLVGKGIIKPLDLWNAALTHIGDNQAARLALWRESGEPTEGLYIQRSDETWCIYKFIDGHPHFQHGGSWKRCDLGIYPGTMKLMHDGYYNILTEAEALAKGGAE